jgi:ABC-type uncharacterized transport system substrate-binding protein
MKKAEIVEILEEAKIEIPEGAKVEDLKALAEDNGIQLEEAPVKLVRMYFVLKNKKSSIDIPEDQVEAHKKAGWYQ